MTRLWLRPDRRTGFIRVVGVGGIGTGIIFALHGNHTLGRNESRMGDVVDARDYCKLHIVEHYIAVLLGLARDRRAFEVVAVGNVGADAAGTTLLREMEDVGIDVGHVRIERECRTMFSTVFVYPDTSGGNITATNANCKLSAEQIAECRGLLQDARGRSIALCLPEVPMDKREQFLRMATGCGAYRIASFASAELTTACALELLGSVDLLALNREEAMELASSNPRDGSEAQMLDACARIATARNPPIKILVSVGSEGAYAFESGSWSKHDAIATSAISTAGAGDALLGGTIAGLIAGMPLAGGTGPAANGERLIATAIDLGLALAAFSVTSPHTIHPDATLESLLGFCEKKGLVISQSMAHCVSRGEVRPDRAGEVAL